jgi:hypothetical protein
MFSSLSDFGKELVLLTADAVAFIFTLHWHRNNRRAEEALLVCKLKAQLDEA